MNKQSSVICVFFLLALLAGCERPATRSSWAPLDSTPVLPSTTASITSTAKPTKTPAPLVTPTPVPVVTIAMNALAEKYPLAGKGYELLTWQKDGQWVYTLLAGTNRQKSFDEILAAENVITATEIIKVSVIGPDDFKELLTHLPKGEFITWGGMDLSGEVPAGTVYFSYPPDDTIKALVDYSKSLGINLSSLKGK